MSKRTLELNERTEEELSNEAEYPEYKFRLYVTGYFNGNDSGKKWYEQLLDKYVMWSGYNDSYDEKVICFQLTLAMRTRENVDAFIKYARRCSAKIHYVSVYERIFVEPTPKPVSKLVPPTTEELAAMAEEDAIRLEPGYKLIDPLFKYTAFHSLLTACRLPLNSEELRNDPEFGKGLGYDDELGDAWYYFEENEEEYKSYEGYNGFKRDLKRAFLAWNA